MSGTMSQYFNKNLFWWNRPKVPHPDGKRFIRYTSVHPNWRNMAHEEEVRSTMYLVKKGDLELLKKHLVEGPTYALFCVDSHGFTPLMNALHRKHPKPHIALLILQFIAEYEQQNPYPEYVIEFLQARDTSGRQQTALHLAARLGNVEIVKILVDFGCDRTLQDAGGYTAAVIAAKHKRDPKLIRMLESRQPLIWRPHNHLHFDEQFQKGIWTLLLIVQRAKIWFPKDVWFLICNRIL
jgi:hypothetical protein